MHEKQHPEKTFSWSTSGHSILQLNIRQLCLFGIWPLCESRLFDAYSALVLALSFWNVLEGVLSVSYTGVNLEETTLVLANTFTTFSGLVKGSLFVWDRQHYYAIAQSLDALVSAQSEACSKDATLEHMLRSSRRSATRITLGVLLFLLLQALLWFPTPLIAHPGERRLPLVQHYWAGNNSYYELSYVVQCAAAYYSANVSFGMDCLMATIMILVSSQLKILSARIAALGTEHTELAKEVKCRFDSPLAPSEEKMYKNLCVCIENHQQILRFVKDLQHAMNPVAMTQIVCSVLVACVALFQATYSTDMAAVLQCIGFLPVPGGQVFLYCWAAQSVADEAEALSAAAYGSGWVGSGADFRGALRLLMCRARRRLAFTAGHCYPVDRAAFLSLVNASYSYYALLGQMNRR